MTSLRQHFLKAILLTLVLTGCKSEEKKTTVETEKQVKPNIVFIYMDDLGYGDLSAYGATEISTPNMDALAKGGVKFTNGYATSATCTPSRYAILTGRYPWRNEDAKILPGTAPLIIDTEQLTVPKMLKEEAMPRVLWENGIWGLVMGMLIGTKGFLRDPMKSASIILIFWPPRKIGYLPCTLKMGM